jgi:hypothetical protein
MLTKSNKPFVNFNDLIFEQSISSIELIELNNPSKNTGPYYEIRFPIRQNQQIFNTQMNRWWTI